MCLLSCFNYVQLFVTLWPVACQALLSMEFSRQEHWSRLPCPPLGDLPDPGSESASLMSVALAGRFFIPVPPGKPIKECRQHQINSEKGENTFSWAVERGSQS